MGADLPRNPGSIWPRGISSLHGHYERAVSGLLPQKGRRRVVAVTALERGAGRSTTCLGLAQAACGLGYRSAVVDCHLDRPHLHLLLGEPNFVGLSTALHNDAPLQDYGCEVSSGLLIVPAGPRLKSGVTEPWAQTFGPAVRALSRSYPLVLLDVPLAERLRRCETLHRALDGALVVTRYQRAFNREVRETVRALGESGVEVLGIIFNRCPAGREEA